MKIRKEKKKNMDVITLIRTGEMLSQLSLFFINKCQIALIHSVVLPQINVVFLDGDNFCKAFAGAQVNLSYYEWRSHE